MAFEPSYYTLPAVQYYCQIIHSPCHVFALIFILCSQPIHNNCKRLHHAKKCVSIINFVVYSETEKLYLPELLHNLQLLVDHTEQDILQSNRKLHYNKDLLVNLKHEKEGLVKEVEEEQAQIDKLSGVFEVVEV